MYSGSIHDRRLRIATVTSHVDISGITTVLLNVLPRLDPQRFENLIICLKKRGKRANDFERRGIDVHTTRVHGRGLNPISVIRLMLLLQRLRPHVVHAHGTVPAIYATTAARLARVPVIIAHHHGTDSIQRPGQARHERRQSSFHDATVHVSHAVHRYYLDRVQPHIDSGRVIYNGIDADRATQPIGHERRQDLEQALGITQRHPRVLCPARLQPDKGQDEILNAFEILRTNHPNAVLLLTGTGDLFEPLAKRIRAHGLSDTVKLLGNRNDMDSLYQIADFGVLYSIREGFSLVVLEAMAYGLPMVLTDVGGNREAIGDSGAAIIIPAGDHGALRSAMSQLMSDRAAVSKMSQVARQRVRNFPLDAQVQAFADLYQELALAKGLAVPELAH